VIAELSGNHNKSLDSALQLVKAAAEVGADAVKLQTYTPDTMTIDSDSEGFVIRDSGSIWNERKLYDLYQQASTPWEWHETIFAEADRLGVTCFSSPFDDSAVDFLEELGAPAYKIASAECVDLPLIKKVAMTGKPLIISTGMADLSEIEEAVICARANGCEDLSLLKCTSSYPAPYSEINLNTIPHMRALFECDVGLSDHTLGSDIPIASCAFGAKIIEKHLCLSRDMGGVDSTFSMEPSEMRALIVSLRNVSEALGGVFYGPTKSEMGARSRRRSLYFSCDLKEGEALRSDHFCRLRPSLGLPPRFHDSLIGMVLDRDVNKGEPIKWSMIRSDETR
jgi:pseudaminic acid synthase